MATLRPVRQSQLFLRFLTCNEGRNLKMKDFFTLLCIRLPVVCCCRLKVRIKTQTRYVNQTFNWANENYQHQIFIRDRCDCVSFASGQVHGQTVKLPAWLFGYDYLTIIPSFVDAFLTQHEEKNRRINKKHKIKR